MNPIEQRIAEIEERLAKATPGPWSTCVALGPPGFHVCSESDSVSHSIVVPGIAHVDASLIAHAPADLAWAVERIKALEAKIIQVAAECHKSKWAFDDHDPDSDDPRRNLAFDTIHELGNKLLEGPDEQD